MPVVLPRNALQRIQIGQAFAEYDIVRDDPSVFVATPASIVASHPENAKCFFVGRRGAGKTAITYNLIRHNRRAVSIAPQVFDLVKLPLSYEEFHDTRQRPFKSLVCSFERALLGELVKRWTLGRIWQFSDDFPHLNRERGLIDNCDFDQRVLNLVSEIFAAFSNPNERLWLRQINRAKEITEEVNAAQQNRNFNYAFLIDRLDDSWDGSDSAIISLMALMHACVRLLASCRCIQPYLFIRENIFTRIRALDNEFSRLETSVVFLDWSEEKLTEFVERRMVRPFNTKPAIGGEAWGNFFEEDTDHACRKEIFSYCQFRPRDVLTYINFALESAISRAHQKITMQDLLAARERFSTSKLKDLGDEFAENYPNISLVLKLFYGLSTEYTIGAIENFIQRLIVDHDVSRYCRDWFLRVTTTHDFIGVLFSIGFVGISEGRNWIYKAAGGDAAFMPALAAGSIIRIHPAYHAALHLRDMVLPEIAAQTALQVAGILEDLPEGVSFDTYYEKLDELQKRLDYIPKGVKGARAFEDFVGDLIRLCFFRTLSNVQEKSRDYQGTIIRDWIAANRANTGFWSIVRDKYSATQVVWECKNYEELAADDFHQASYYMNNVTGRFVVITFRGNEVSSSYFRHIQLISRNSNGLVLLLSEKDVRVFIRQALKGKYKEDHIADLFDRTVRAIG